MASHSQNYSAAFYSSTYALESCHFCHFGDTFENVKEFHLDLLYSCFLKNSKAIANNSSIIKD